MASLSQIIPGKSIEYYLNELPYAQGLQFQSIELGKNGCEFEAISKDSEDSFAKIAGF